jgi:hypothetical protein
LKGSQAEVGDAEVVDRLDAVGFYANALEIHLLRAIVIPSDEQTVTLEKEHVH